MCETTCGSSRIPIPCRSWGEGTSYVKNVTIKSKFLTRGLGTQRHCIRSSRKQASIGLEVQEVIGVVPIKNKGEKEEEEAGKTRDCHAV